jgi:hypothetical protein
MSCRHLDPDDELFGVNAEMVGYEQGDCPEDCEYYKECWGK